MTGKRLRLSTGGTLRLAVREKIEFLYCWDVRGCCIWNPRNVELIDIVTGVSVPKVDLFEHLRLKKVEEDKALPFTQMSGFFMPTNGGSPVDRRAHPKSIASFYFRKRR